MHMHRKRHINIFLSCNKRIILKPIFKKQEGYELNSPGAGYRLVE